MTELELESADRYQLVKYLLARLLECRGAVHRHMVRSELQEQKLETLLLMAKLTCRVELARQKRRQDVRAARRATRNEHTR